MKTIKRNIFCSLGFSTSSYHFYYFLEYGGKLCSEFNKNCFILWRESVSSVMPAVLSTAVSGLTGSNPVSRILFFHINNNFPVIINFIHLLYFIYILLIF